MNLPRIASLVTAICLLTAGCASQEAHADRLVTTHQGGLQVLDAESLAVLHTVELPGFIRVNPAGDGRHVIVSTSDAFRVLDTRDEAKLTEVSFPAAKPGHVVRHAGKTVLFSDGSGRVEAFDSTALAGGERPASRVYTAAAPHHGVAVELADGRLLVTLGTDKARVGAALLDREHRELARNEACPGVHGEAAAKDEAVVIGCQNGALVYAGGRFTKVTSPDPYGRVGSAAGSEESAVVLGDYKSDPNAELERPERVALIDTASGTMRLVNLGTSYTFRSLGRGPGGSALVLGTDGALHVIDPNTAAVTARIPVLAPWSEPLEWQRTRPALFVREHTAYITEPAANKIHAVDLTSNKVRASQTLPATPIELTGP